jgi:subtilisin family serine protease
MVESRTTPKEFDPNNLNRTVIATPLLKEIQVDITRPFHVIIDLNLDYPGRRDAARHETKRAIERLMAANRQQLPDPVVEFINQAKSQFTPQYIFACLTGDTIKKLAKQMVDLSTETKAPPIYRIWPDFKTRHFCNVSISTVKADAARVAFGASGADIVWAVMDTGIDASHPHFARYSNLDVKPPLRHRDFTTTQKMSEIELGKLATKDVSGHGTHVAGIIAGELQAAGNGKLSAAVLSADENGDAIQRVSRFTQIAGMASAAKLVSLKVLKDDGSGSASDMIAAIGYIQQINGNGRRLKIHGVNMSVGYDFEPEWFACGQSPLCVEVNRLVRSGVIVVTAAGNTGYGYVQAEFNNSAPAGLAVTINDPGNADLAITVGSTHRESPHVYGVSYFSSKGPTGDGRKKPDLIAPGEKIISCMSTQYENGHANKAVQYREDSGTSMAAPHVSGVIAAFLSIRKEFIGRPERVKEIFLSTATDLKRASDFQGNGLVDLMRAIQSI